jgi:hypothetical protein
MVDTRKKKEPEKIVQAHVLRNTSVQGRLLIAGTTVPLPLSHAKAMREAGTVRPVPKVTESHPKPPPEPKVEAFDGESDEDKSEDEDDDEEPDDADAEIEE